MAGDDKTGRRMETGRNPQELHDWMFSLIPLVVAFSFFLVFVWSLDIPHKKIIIAIGAAAAFIGFETYWIFRGLRKNHLLTVAFGIAGIAITIVLVWLYIVLT